MRFSLPCPAGGNHAQTQAGEHARDQLDHGFGPPRLWRQHAASLANAPERDDSKLSSGICRADKILLPFLILQNFVNPVAVTANHTNRLAQEKSPYLLQHAHNPVDWFAWNDEAFTKARTENKPIFLSIGYSTCHWCHVMERESFEQETTGKFLNEHFVSIKVDREERPDVDKIYMTFVQSTTGSGGWPMSVFLTPERKPFFGGTYFPPDARHGRPSFLQLLEQIAGLWRERKMEIAASADELHARLCLLYTSPSPRDRQKSRMPSSA